jgi:Tfp pilus assembly protein PilZ
MLNNAGPRHEAEFTKQESGTGASSEVREASGRREHDRFGVELDVTVTSEHNFYAGFVENMSVGGVFIATHQLKPVGSRLEPIKGAGEVRWVRVYSEASNVPPGMGIKFDPLAAEAVRAIEEFLAQREPLFYDED